MKDILLVMGALLVLWYTPIFLYEWRGVFKWWFHDVMKWHQPNNLKKWKGGDSIHSTCKFCGKEITRDYRGYWLTDDEW